MLPTRPGRSLHWVEFGDDFQETAASSPVLIGQNSILEVGANCEIAASIMGRTPSAKIILGFQQI
jgi:hypothetical protein